VGVDDYLTKPLHPERLVQLLEQFNGSMPNDSAAPETAPDTEALADQVVHTMESLIGPDDPDAIRSILQNFLSTADSAQEAVESAFEARDADALETAVHRLKSSSLTIGAEPLARVCQRIEQECRDDPDWEQVAGHIRVFESVYPSVVDAVHAVVRDGLDVRS
jgi:HPt (histidine-containing phosphotransfer) domain-containing protein